MSKLLSAESLLMEGTSLVGTVIGVVHVGVLVKQSLWQSINAFESVTFLSQIG